MILVLLQWYLFQIVIDTKHFPIPITKKKRLPAHNKTDSCCTNWCFKKALTWVKLLKWPCHVDLMKFCINIIFISTWTKRYEKPKSL